MVSLKSHSGFEIGGAGGGGGGVISGSILGGGDSRHFFLLLTLYHLENIGRLAPWPPCCVVPESVYKN